MATSFQEDPFWMSKMKYQFEMLFDLDGSGSNENVDFNKLFDVEMKNLAEWDPLCVQTTDMKRHLWAALHHIADDNKDKADLSLSEWCSFWDYFADKHKRSKLPLWYIEFIDVTFSIMDKNDDERIDASDFASYYNETHKLPLGIVEAAFKKISNGEPIERGLFKEMMLGFTVSKDMEHPGNILGEMMVNGRKV